MSVGFDASEYRSLVREELKLEHAKPTILIIGSISREKQVVKKDDLRKLLEIVRQARQNLFVFLIIGQIKTGEILNQRTINDAAQYLKATNKSALKYLNWQNYEQTFTGRIMIDLADEHDYGMSFELESSGESRVYCKRFLDSERGKSTADVLPALIDFATKKDLDLVLLLDLNLLLTSNAFDQSKIKETLEEKIQEARNCDKYLIIIDVGSLVNATKNVSVSSMGNSESYNLSDPKVYSLILNYIKTYPKIIGEKKQWVAFISDSKALSRYLKDDLKWPLNVREIRENE